MDNIFNLLLQCMNFASELVVSLCLGVFLLITDWKMCLLMVFLLGVLTLINVKVIKKHLNIAGEGSRITQAGMYKWILQGASGIKDVKVLRKEYYFTDRYSDSAEGYADNQIKYNVLTNLPRLLIEAVAILGILIYCITYDNNCSLCSSSNEVASQCQQTEYIYCKYCILRAGIGLYI